MTIATTPTSVTSGDAAKTSKLAQEARTFGEWAYAQVASVVGAHKAVAGVLVACGFVAGCIIH